LEVKKVRIVELIRVLRAIEAGKKVIAPLETNRLLDDIISRFGLEGAITFFERIKHAEPGEVVE
jgi:hypothetical protein